MNIDLSKRRFLDDTDENGVNVLYGLYDLIVENVKPNYIICEIGSFKGVSSELFANFCQKLYCVDPWMKYIEVNNEQRILDAEKYFDTIAQKYSNIEKIKNFSVEASKQFNDEYLDMVYIDGAHDYQSVINDIIAWFPKVKPGGIISGHDSNQPQVYGAILNCIKFRKMTIYSDSSWCIIK